MAVLASEPFRRSPKLSRLLGYLCDQQLKGLADEITEYSIAHEALGRNAQFDPQQDAVVRVDIHHLRKRLKEYYAGAGADHAIRIVIPNGRYAPQFTLRDLARLPAEPAAAEITESKPAAANWVRRRWHWFSALALAALLVTWSAPHYRQAVARLVGAGAAPKLPGAVTGPGTAEPQEIRIAVGGNSAYTDAAGRTWLPDRYFSGGATFRRPATQIQRTRDPDLFRNGREGQFVYAIPLHPGIYELHLYFAETGVASDTLRSVNVGINGQPPATFDVASDAGGANTATEKILKDISPASDGFLRLTFQGGPNFLNAIEIVPGIRGKIRPIRISAGDHAFRDHLGQAWLPDQWAAGGRKSTRVVSVDGTADAGLYQWERVGHFTYSIPVTEGGLYTVALYFSETWFTPPNFIGGVGRRVFDVYCNGTTLLRGFDILKESGGIANRAVIRVFKHVPASPLGKIDLTFVPVVNYALINAIEVTEE